MTLGMPFIIPYSPKKRNSLATFSERNETPCNHTLEEEMLKSYRKIKNIVVCSVFVCHTLNTISIYKIRKENCFVKVSILN